MRFGLLELYPDAVRLDAPHRRRQGDHFALIRLAQRQTHSDRVAVVEAGADIAAIGHAVAIAVDGIVVAGAGVAAVRHAVPVGVFLAWIENSQAVVRIASVRR